MNFQSIENPIRWLFFLHAIFGSVALLLISVPLFSKKGGKLHVRAGWIYVIAMGFVGLSALIISPWRMAFDPERTTRTSGFAIFLAFITVFTFSALWHGLIALKGKTRKAPVRSLKFIGPPLTVVLLGLLVQLAGSHLHYPLLITFPFVSHIVSIGQLKYWLTKPEGKMHWWFAHMNGMITASIATITAFLVTAVPKIWPNQITESPLLWIAPGIVLGIIAKKWSLSYKKRFYGLRS